MSRSRVTDDFCVKISVQISRSDEVVYEFSAERLIQRGKNQFGMLRVRLLSGESDFQHGSDDGGGHAVTGNIRNENAELIFFQREEIVEIAGDRTHREITSGDVQTSDAGHFARKNR